MVTKLDPMYFCVAVTALLADIGEDPRREGLLDTPERVLESYRELTSGYKVDPLSVFTTFEAEGYDQIVLVKDVPLTSLCEHHLLPFIGVAHVGYIPRHRIAGLSKFKRLVDIYARRLQVQERLTRQVLDTIVEVLEPRGAMVVVEAEHTCMTIRGVQAPGSRTVTSAVAGDFLNEAEARAEFLSLVGRKG
ncbi:MAG TPA: GTP cyclohydrolase I FolE [Ktedonobacteraceae bacterium]